MSEERYSKRPGGKLASRPLHFFWAVDCSSSMSGDKIGAVNHAIQEALPDMRAAAKDNPNAELLIRALQFSTGASWVTPAWTNVDEFFWTDMDANGVTDLGEAFRLLAAELSIPPMPERALPPVIVLLSDGLPTDNYEPSLKQLLALPWAKKAVRIAIAIGSEVDEDVLLEFTGNRELILHANNSSTLVKLIKWASTVAASVSKPNSRRSEDGDAPATDKSKAEAKGIPMETLPDTDEDDGVVW